MMIELIIPITLPLLVRMFLKARVIAEFWCAEQELVWPLLPAKSQAFGRQTSYHLNSLSFVATEFGGGRHAGRVAKINALDS